jgi:hypothetical protein
MTLISAALLAKRSGLHRTTVLARCKAGKIPGAIRLGRDWLVPVGTVLEPAGKGGWTPGKPRKHKSPD